LSGPPGVGKTTTAKIVAEELGFDVKELNASDTRSKRMLHEVVEQMVVNTALTGFATKRELTCLFFSRGSSSLLSIDPFSQIISKRTLTVA
jgi:DNA polymerase III delta prime subunit